MPYIKQSRRAAFRRDLESISSEVTDAGELNYAIYCLSLSFWKRNKRYFTMALIVGTLIIVALELFRRHFSPYEDSKIGENGEIE